MHAGVMHRSPHAPARGFVFARLLVGSLIVDTPRSLGLHKPDAACGPLRMSVTAYIPESDVSIEKLRATESIPSI